MNKVTATDIATRFHIPLHADFHMLGSDTVENILAASKEWGYRKPKQANGSTARYFYAYLCRSARKSS